MRAPSSSSSTQHRFAPCKGRNGGVIVHFFKAKANYVDGMLTKIMGMLDAIYHSQMHVVIVLWYMLWFVMTGEWHEWEGGNAFVGGMLQFRGRGSSIGDWQGAVVVPRVLLPSRFIR
jgi:hypothetical protein